MKRILIVLFLLSSSLLAQREASNWGTRIQFGTTFTSTDSLKVRKSSYRDTILADTLYSDVLGVDDWVDGIWTVDMFLTNVGGTTDSISLDYRRVTTFKDRESRSTTIKFGAWKGLMANKASGSLHTLGITQADSSWWTAGNGRQYRLYDTSVSTDTTNHLITDFLR